MEIRKLVLGSLNTNCYILIQNNECIIIDPADNALDIMNICKNKRVVEILVTHHHFDHIGALTELEKYYHIKHNNHNSNFSYEIIKTPGHTSDSVSFYFKKERLLFSGDFIFYHTIGRYNFEDSSIYDMKKSINLIKNYPDNIVIYPGHGIETTLKEEKEFNPYF